MSSKMRDLPKANNTGRFEQATESHCLYAFTVLDAHLHGRALPEPWFDDAVTALFVTWNTEHSDSWRLRGCIGTLEPRQLHTALKDYALTAALRDSRFPAIEARELPKLSCKVSLLSCFEKAASWQDWQVGTHGIVIEFVDPQLNCRRSATFLPEVAPEQGWSVRDTLDALVRKSGYNGKVDGALLSKVSLTRYQSSVTGLTWAAYKTLSGGRGHMGHMGHMLIWQHWQRLLHRTWCGERGGAQWRFNSLTSCVGSPSPWDPERQGAELWLYSVCAATPGGNKGVASCGYTVWAHLVRT